MWFGLNHENYKHWFERGVVLYNELLFFTRLQNISLLKVFIKSKFWDLWPSRHFISVTDCRTDSITKPWLTPHQYQPHDPRHHGPHSRHHDRHHDEHHDRHHDRYHDWPKWWCQGSFALLQCFSNFENNLVGEFHIAYMSQDPELDLVKGLLIILDEH